MDGGLSCRVRFQSRKIHPESIHWPVCRWRGRRISYWADFDTLADETGVVDIPFTNFFPQVRGFKLDGPELDANQITEFALYQYDKTDGPFELRLISVEAYMESKQP